jgi:hypothetical protein
MAPTKALLFLVAALGLVSCAVDGVVIGTSGTDTNPSDPGATDLAADGGDAATSSSSTPHGDALDGGPSADASDDAAPMDDASPPAPPPPPPPPDPPPPPPETTPFPCGPTTCDARTQYCERIVADPSETWACQPIAPGVRHSCAALSIVYGGRCRASGEGFVLTRSL